MSYDMNDYRRQLYDTYLLAGIPLISSDKCCRLLAWLSVYGGENEQVVLDGRLNNAILYAQKRLNIIGGEAPDLELLPVLQNYIRSAADKHGRPYSDTPEWVVELEKEYGIRSYKAESRQKSELSRS